MPIMIGSTGADQVSSKKAAAYARFSSDMQQDRSIQDQFTVCDGIAEREGFKIAAIDKFSDRAKSGASLFERDGLEAMMAAAKRGRFSALIVESLDRLSRDQEDLAHLFKRLSYYGVDIVTSEGKTTSIHVGIRGIIGSMFLKDLGDKVKRGQTGRAREGKIMGSVPYGYRVVLGKKGEPEIVREHAKIVVRIYRLYVEGWSPRNIAIKLTSEGVASPNGGRWNAPTITAILRNQFYAGVRVWNATRRVRNPETGKKLKRHSPDQALTAPVPHLRIVEQELWDAAKALRAKRATHVYGPAGKRPAFIAKGQHLLSGMLRCGVCGGHMRNKSFNRGAPWAACAAADAHKACSHTRTYDMNRLQVGVLAGLRTHLTDPTAIKQAAKAYHEQYEKRSKQNRADADSLRKQLSRLQLKMDRLVTAITDSDVPVLQLTAQLKPLEVERAGLAERLRLIEAEGNVVDLHPSVLKTYQANVEQLHEALTKNALTPENRLAFRNLIDSIVVFPTDKRMPYDFVPYGRLGAMMGIDLFPTIRSNRQILAEQEVGVVRSGKPLNRSLAVSQHEGKVVPLGRWAA